jgi:hypothetical protein
MYSILVTAENEAWETDQLMRIRGDRFYVRSTREAANLSTGDAASLQLLEGTPALLMYELGGPHVDVVRFGTIRSVAYGGHYLTFMFEEQGRVPRQVVRDHGSRVGLTDSEFCHTHWGVNDGGIPRSILEHLYAPAGAATRSLTQALLLTDLPAVEAEVSRALRSVDTDPAAALTAACALVESLLKAYIADEGLEMPSDQAVGHLWGRVSRHIGLHSGSIADRNVQKICTGLASVMDGVAALRTHAGTAHGRGRDAVEVTPRHARLAVHAAHTFATFVIETWTATRNVPSRGEI